MLAAVTATSGDVIFTGELTGDFIALDARNGNVVYRFPGGGAIVGGVISYAAERQAIRGGCVRNGCRLLAGCARVDDADGVRVALR